MRKTNVVSSKPLEVESKSAQHNTMYLLLGACELSQLCHVPVDLVAPAHQCQSRREGYSQIFGQIKHADDFELSCQTGSQVAQLCLLCLQFSWVLPFLYSGEGSVCPTLTCFTSLRSVTASEKRRRPKLRRNVSR